MNRTRQTALVIALLCLLMALCACATQPAAQGNVDATVAAIIAATGEAQNVQDTIEALENVLAQGDVVETPTPLPPALEPPPEAEQSDADIQAAIGAAANATIQAENAIATSIAATLTAAVTATPTPNPTDTPTPVPSSTPTAEPIPTNTPQPQPQAPPPTTDSPIIAGFEAWGTWRRGDEGNGTFAQSAAQVEGGSYSGKLSYNFAANDPKNYVVFHQRRAIPGQPHRIEAWVYGDGSKHFLNLWIVDARNQTWQFSFGQVEHNGWQLMTTTLDPTAGWPNQAISPADATEVTYPLRFDAIVFDGYQDDQSSSGVIYIDNIAVPDSVVPTSGSTPIPTASQLTPVPVAQASGRIALPAFDTSRGQYDIYVVNADGSGMQRVIANASQPALSPNGQRIAFRHWKSDDRGVVVMNTHGGNQHRLTNFGEDMQPAWSANGRNIIFASRRESDRKNRIYQIGVDGGDDWGLRRGDSAVFGGFPSWLPDGRVVYRSTSPQLELTIMNADGSAPVRIIGDGEALAPTISPDGRSLLYMSRRTGNWEVYRASSGGTDIVQLTNNSANDGLPVWSPDSSRIAFVSDRNGQWAVWLMNRNGGDQRQLVTIPGSLDGRVNGEQEYNSRGWTEERLSWSQ